MRNVALIVAMLGACGSGGVHSQAAPAPEAVFPPHPGRAVVVRACVPCHAPELVVAKRRTEDEWDRVIAAMLDRGAVADEGEQQQILEYFVQLFGTPSETSAPRD